MTDAINKAHSAASKAISEMVKAEAPAATKQSPGVVRRTSQFFVDPARVIEQEGFNSRFDLGEIEVLAASIKNRKTQDGHGLINDLRLQRIPADHADKARGDFWSTGGHRRMAAIRMLMKKGEVFELGVPAKIDAVDTPELERLITRHEDNAQKPLLPLEMAIDFKKMRDAGMTIAQIMKATGKSDNTINDCLALLESDDSVTDAVKGGKVTAGMAKKIAVYARGDKAKQKELIEQAKAAGKDKTKKAELKKSIEATQRAKHAKKGHVLKIRALTDAELSGLGETLAQALKLKLEAAGMSFDADLSKWVGADSELQMAFTFGALQALKAAAGMSVKLDV